MLPDGYIYGYFDAAESVLLYTNQLPISTAPSGGIYNGIGYKAGVRWSTSGNAENDADGGYLSGLIPAKIGDIVRLKNVGMDVNGNAKINCVAFIPSGGSASQWALNGNELIGQCAAVVDEDDNVVQFTSPVKGYFRLNASYIGADSVVTVNEEIESTDAIEAGWRNTGHAFVPADYEHRIVALENAMRGDMNVYGIVDSENNIFLTGTLASGTYSMQYLHEDGSTTKICDFEM